MTDRYAVIGNPVAHSLSPEIHAAFAAQTGQAMHYDRLPAEPDAFAATARAFFEAGGRGLNVTVPFKLDAADFADRLSDRARAAGAVNTLIAHDQGRIEGDNTDGAGLLRDLQHNRAVTLTDRRLLVLGAGGASQGVIGPLLAAEPASLIIANRTASKAQSMAEYFAVQGPVRGIGFADLADSEPVDVLINATSAGLAGALPALPANLLAAGATAYDMVYGAASQPFQDWARQHGAAAVCDGLGMLVEQASESFHRWRGVRPDTAPVLRQLRAKTG